MMNKIFEDEFTDIQSQIISLCLEFSEQVNIERIYAYCSIEGNATSFNAAFVENGIIKLNTEIDSNLPRTFAFLKAGCSDTKKIKEICEKYQKPIPTEIKMYYDVQTGKFKADYKYSPICIDISPGEFLKLG